MERKFLAYNHLIDCYLHQDFYAEHGSVDGAIYAFISNEPQSLVQALKSDLIVFIKISGEINSKEFIDFLKINKVNPHVFYSNEWILWIKYLVQLIDNFKNKI